MTAGKTLQKLSNSHYSLTTHLESTRTVLNVSEQSVRFVFINFSYTQVIQIGYFGNNSLTIHQICSNMIDGNKNIIKKIEDTSKTIKTFFLYTAN